MQLLPRAALNANDAAGVIGIFVQAVRSAQMCGASLRLLIEKQKDKAVKLNVRWVKPALLLRGCVRSTHQTRRRKPSRTTVTFPAEWRGFFTSYSHKRETKPNNKFKKKKKTDRRGCLLTAEKCPPS